ncbi:MAG: hypothetical protein ABW277_08855 [Longimicrobiaceae bacterium]
MIRFTADPLNLRENSSCDSDICSVNSAPCTPSLAQNAVSAVGVENLRGYGHTSWEVCQLYVFPL